MPDWTDLVLIPIVVYLVGQLLWDKLNRRDSNCVARDCPLLKSSDKAETILHEIKDGLTHIKAKINGK